MADTQEALHRRDMSSNVVRGTGGAIVLFRGRRPGCRAWTYIPRDDGLDQAHGLGTIELPFRPFDRYCYDQLPTTLRSSP